MTPLLPLAVFVVGVVAFLLWQHQREQKRREQLAMFALSKGWEFSPVDHLGLADRWQRPPFGQGHSRRASNLFTGEVDGRAFLAFDYRYKVTSSNGKTTTTHTYTFGVCALSLPAWLPRVEMSPESMLSRLGGALGFDDVELESEDFNRAFRVHGNRKLAHDVLSPRVMEVLLRGGCPSLRIEGAEIVGWDGGHTDISELLAMLDTLSRVVAAVPSFVWKDHGYDPGQGSPEAGSSG